MATVTGLTAARMQEIIDQQISSGAIDLSGHLIFTREDGSTFDAGVAKGAKGDPAVYDIPGFPSSGSFAYVRLATLDGLNASNGAHVQFDLSGLGNFGTARRGSVRVDAVQRNADGIHLRAWGTGTDQASSDAIKLYTRRLGEYLFEIWARFGNYTSAPTYSDNSKWHASLNLDGITSTEPSDLVEWPVTVVGASASSTLAGLVELATAAEIQAGTDTARVPTPKTLADAGGVTPVGSITMFSGSTAPAGHLLCQGQAVSRTTYARLYAVIGTTYGAGDGSTTFNIPNLKGRVPVGLDSGDSTFDVRGETGGEKTVTLGYREIPVQKGARFTWGQGNIGFNTQPQAYAGAPSGNGLGTWQNDARYDADAANNFSSGGQPHNNLQPFIVLHYIIKF